MCNLVKPLIFTNLDNISQAYLVMKINVLTQLREMIEDLLSGQTNLQKNFRNFFIETMILYIVMRGRINYTSMSMVGDSCDSRFRQNFQRSFDWLGFNMQFAAKMLTQRIAIAIDPSYIDKSGKKTPGLSYFWSGCAKMAKWGLLQITHLIVADSFFANGPFAKGLETMGFDLISRLHDNAKMQYIYTGTHTGRGRPRKFTGKVELNSLDSNVFTNELTTDDNGKPILMHVGEVWVNCLERICKVVIVDFIDPDKKKQIRKVYFSTDRTLSGQDIFDLYRTRFQIEFLYRSGKGLTGLTHCQARNEQALDFAFNMSLSTINLMRSYAANFGFEQLSDASVKMLVHNAFMIDRFISTFGKPPKLRKNDNTVKELIFYGVRDAA